MALCGLENGLSECDQVEQLDVVCLLLGLVVEMDKIVTRVYVCGA